METIEAIALIIFIIAVVFIIGGIIWFLATLGPIPGWGWLIVIGLAMLAILYIVGKALEE